ncbi:MAG: lysA [Mycobacterium sp.]|nr:lysA [Mycobacterium sp.]
MGFFQAIHSRTSTDRVQRCCSHWHTSFPEAEVVYPMGALRTPAAAQWLRAHGLGLSASSDDDLARVIAAGIAPRSVVLHCHDLPARSVWQAVGLGVGQYIVGARGQVSTLAACAERPRCVVLDVTHEHDDDAVQAMLDEPHLEVSGLHSGLDRVDTVDGLIALMAQLRYHRGVLMTRISVAMSGADDRAIEAIASQLDDTIEGGCARFRYPRPVVQVCPDSVALTRET